MWQHGPLPGRVAQLARALPLQGRCRGFESLRAHNGSAWSSARCDVRMSVVIDAGCAPGAHDEPALSGANAQCEKPDGSAGDGGDGIAGLRRFIEVGPLRWGERIAGVRGAQVRSIDPRRSRVSSPIRSPPSRRAIRADSASRDPFDGEGGLDASDAISGAHGTLRGAHPSEGETARPRPFPREPVDRLQWSFCSAGRRWAVAS